ncbi:hypothetical protein EC988_002850 [Linderina pennispora]|nr:hypothetical protein EC988_002850 [Linderina pennispora]
MTSAIAHVPKSHTVIGSSVIPITVFTGFLGAGKTSIILNLLKRTDPDYKIVLLKNEFGDAETDSALVRESHIQVTEMTNGCLCCVLVGQMKLALEEMKAKYSPDRIIVETSGSAFPAPIAWQIREMESEGFHLDAILTVIDCANFCGYEDNSYTAKMQAQYTDLVLLNKWELVNERKLDIVIDHINELNTDTPKIKADKDAGVDPNVVFGLDTNLFRLSEKPADADTSHHDNEVDLIEIRREFTEPTQLLEPTQFTQFLKSLPAEDVYRVKGLVRLSARVEDEGNMGAKLSGEGEDVDASQGIMYILNHAFGRYTFTALTQEAEGMEKTLARITVMGNGLRMYTDKIKQGFSASDDQMSTHWAHRH